MSATVLTYDPLILHDANLLKAKRLSCDPIRQVGAVLLAGGRAFLGSNVVSMEIAAFLDWHDRTLVRRVVRHAEVSAILTALSAGIEKSDFQDSILLVTLEPCLDCQSLIRHFQIPHVIFGERYVPSDSGVNK